MAAMSQYAYSILLVAIGLLMISCHRLDNKVETYSPVNKRIIASHT